MFLETVKTPGLSHLSYVIGDGAEAAVIDPRRDYAVYERIAAQAGVRITAIFETHRNEDLISGAEDLAARAGAEVIRGATDEYDVHYAREAAPRERVSIGEVTLEVLATPGHTLDSISIAARHAETGESVIGVFTGDALFVHDVGRTDFYPDRAEEVAGLLYDSLQALLALGDQAVVYPAHGAGSVCGSGMADRDFTTIGYERAHNPRLQLSCADFVRAKTAEHHEYPPYFTTMETLNAGGAPALAPVLKPSRPLSADELAAARDEGALVVDVRSAESFAGGHVPGAFALPLSLLPAFAGWLLPYETPLILVADDADQVDAARLQLARIGYDEVYGYLSGGVSAWAKTGRAVGTVDAIDGPAFKRAEGSRALLLDVRDKTEFAERRLEGAQNIYAGHLPDKLQDLDPDRETIVFCGSGQRALVAASVLQRAGFSRLKVYWGSMAACVRLGCAMAA